MKYEMESKKRITKVGDLSPGDAFGYCDVPYMVINSKCVNQTAFSLKEGVLNVSVINMQISKIEVFPASEPVIYYPNALLQMGEPSSEIVY